MDTSLRLKQAVILICFFASSLPLGAQIIAPVLGGGATQVPPSNILVATGDSRAVTEPTFPPVCSQLAATKYLVSTNTKNVDPYNATCGSTGGTAGTLGCTGGTSYEPSSSSTSYVASETLDNTALSSALSACPTGQAVELVPGASGQRAFVIAPMSLSSGQNLIIDAGVYLKGSLNLSDYGGTNCGVVTTGSSSCTHLITCPSCTGSGIYGYGTIDGRGWDAYIGGGGSFYGNRIQAYCNARGGPQHGSPACTPGTGNTSYGPNGINLVGASNFTLYKTTVKDSGNFIFNMSGSSNITAWDVKLIAPFEVSNTDGFDPEGSTNVTLTQSKVSNGDNQIAVKATNQASSNITISNNQFGAGIANALGSATQYGITNVLFTNNTQNGNLYNDQSAGIQIGSSGANGGLANQITFQNYCIKNENNTLRFYTNYGGGSGSNTPIYHNILGKNIHVLASTAPYTTGNSGYFTFQGLSGNPIQMQLDNLTIDGVNQGVASQNGITTNQYTNVYSGPSGAIPASIVTQLNAGTSNTITGPGGSTTAFPCTNSTWSPLTGELNLKTPSSNNNQSYNNTGNSSYTLQAVLQPTTEISTKEQPLPTAPVTFLDNGISIGTGSLTGDGTYTFINVTTPPAGAHTYTASYPGDSFYGPYTWGSISVMNPTGLPSDSLDYTCAGTFSPCTTWQYPAMPAAGAGYTDPNYGTTEYRLALPSGTTFANAFPVYSRVQAFNYTGTRMMIAAGTRALLYDATTTPPTPIAQIALNSSEPYPFLDPIDNDVLWGNTSADANIIFFTHYSSSHGLDLRSVDVSTCTGPSSCSLTPTTLASFSCVTDSNSPLGAGIAGNKIETGSGAQGGMFDKTDTYFTFSCDYVNTNGRNEIDLIRWNRATNTVLTQEKWYNVCPGATPSGCLVMTSLPNGANLFRMWQHPDGQHISIIWQTNTTQCPARDSAWVRSCGLEVFDTGYNFIGPGFAAAVHMDGGYDINGNAVMISACYTGTPKDYRCLQIINLNTLSPTAITGTRILLPCSFSYIGSTCDSGTYIGFSKSWHISLTAWQNYPGWGLFSTMMLAGPPQGSKPVLPVATTLGTAVPAAGSATVSPVDMTTIGPAVVSVIDYGTSTAEVVKWTSTTSTTATATFTKTHAASAPVQCVSCGNTGFGAMELLALKIDSTVANLSNAVYYRIGRTHAIRDGDYNCEPHASTDRYFQQLNFGSSWDADCQADTSIYTIWMNLGALRPH